MARMRARLAAPMLIAVGAASTSTPASCRGAGLDGQPRPGWSYRLARSRALGDATPVQPALVAGFAHQYQAERLRRR